MDPDTLGNR